MILLELFLNFFRMGLFTFGGGYAMLPLITETVVSKGWMDLPRILDFTAVSESTPGPFAVNMATYVGNEMGGILGGILATLGVVLPSFIVIIIIVKFIDKFNNSIVVKGCMAGLKPAVIGMIATAVLSVGRSVFFPNGVTTAVFSSPVFWISAAIFIGTLILALKKVNPIIIIILSAAAGIAIGYSLNL